MPTSFDVIVAVIDCRHPNFRTNSSNTDNNIHIEYLLQLLFSVRYAFAHLFWRMIGFSVVRQPTLIPDTQTCSTSQSNDFFSSSLLRHRRRRWYPRYCCGMCGIRFWPCTFHHFTSHRHHGHNIRKTLFVYLPSSPYSVMVCAPYIRFSANELTAVTQKWRRTKHARKNKKNRTIIWLNRITTMTNE